MTLGDVIYSPISWGVLSVCIAGGWYAKKSLFEGFLTGLVAPVFLAFIWGVLYIASAFPYALLSVVWPEGVASVTEFYASLSWQTGLLLHPATLVTACLFAMFCRLERQLDGKARGYAPRRVRLGARNPFRKGFGPGTSSPPAFVADKWRRARARGLRVLDRAKKGTKYHPRLERFSKVFRH
jgi:hypothetical protein